MLIFVAGFSSSVFSCWGSPGIPYGTFILFSVFINHGGSAGSSLGTFLKHSLSE